MVYQKKKKKNKENGKMVYYPVYILQILHENIIYIHTFSFSVLQD